MLSDTEEESPRNSVTRGSLVEASRSNAISTLVSADGKDSKYTSLGALVSKIDIAKILSMTPASLLHDLAGLCNEKKLVEPVYQSRRAAVLFVDISGYTLVADMLQKKYGQADGSERLSIQLNSYFTQIIEVINQYGGETPLYCGDAVCGMWLVDSDEEYKIACQRVVTCAAELLSEKNSFPVDDRTFGVHIGAACGEVVTMVIGGFQSLEHGKYKYVTTGEPVLKAAKAVGCAIRDQFAIYESLYKEGKQHFDLEADPLQDNFYMYKKHRHARKTKLPPDPTLTGPDFRLAAASFSCDPAIRFAAKENTVGELRVVSSVFICFYEISKTLVTMTPKEQHEAMQAHFRIVQKKLKKYGGICNKIFQDDKGVLALCNFGLPGYVHDDDALRSMCFALEVSSDVYKRLKTHACIGVSRASVFLGCCGAPWRFEYTVLGDSVNVAARQMAFACGLIKPEDETGMVVCDLDTHKVMPPALRSVDFGAVGQIKVRNKPVPIPVLKPKWRDETQPDKDQAAIVAEIMFNAKLLLCADRCSVFVVNVGQNNMTAHFENGNQVTMSIEAGLAGFVARTGETVNIPDAYQDERFNQAIDKATGYRTTSMLCMPVKDDETIVAVAQLINKMDDSGKVIPFIHIDEELFETFSSYIATSLRNYAARQKAQSQDMMREGKDIKQDVELLDREVEARKLMLFIEAVKNRDAPETIVDIQGSNGTGKSSLLRKYMSLLRNKGGKFFVLMNGQAGKPYGALSDALQAAIRTHKITNEWLLEHFPADEHPNLSALANIVDIPDLNKNILTSSDDAQSRIPRLVLDVLRHCLGTYHLLVEDLDEMDTLTASFVLAAITDDVPTIVTRSSNDVFANANARAAASEHQSATGKDDLSEDGDVEVKPKMKMSAAAIAAVEQGLKRVFAHVKTLKLQLGPVSINAFQSRFKQLLNCKEIAPEIVEQVHAKTHGNLGFAIEVVRALKQCNQISISPDKVAIINGNMDIGKVLDSLSTVQAVLTKTLDTLDDRLINVLRVCAVIGNTILESVAVQACERYSRTKDNKDVSGCLDALEVAGILTGSVDQMEKSFRSKKRQSVASRLRFTHPMMKDAIYNQMLSAERQELHLVVSKVLETFAHYDPGRIANHYARGGDIPSAIKMLYKAALGSLEKREIGLCMKHLGEIDRLLTTNSTIQIDADLMKEIRFVTVKAQCDVLEAEDSIDMILEELLERGERVPEPDEGFAMSWALFKETTPVLKSKKPNEKMSALYSLLADNAFVASQPKTMKLATLRSINYAPPKSEDLQIRGQLSMIGLTHLVYRKMKDAQKLAQNLEKMVKSRVYHTVVSATAKYMGTNIADYESTRGKSKKSKVNLKSEKEDDDEEEINDTSSYVTVTAEYYSNISAVTQALFYGECNVVFPTLAKMADTFKGAKFMSGLKILHAFLLCYLKKPALRGRVQDSIDEVGQVLGALKHVTNLTEKWQVAILSLLLAVRKDECIAERDVEKVFTMLGPDHIPNPVDTLVYTALAEICLHIRSDVLLAKVIALLEATVVIHPVAEVSVYLWKGVYILCTEQHMRKASIEWMKGLDAAHRLKENAPLFEANRIVHLLATRGTVREISLSKYLTTRGMTEQLRSSYRKSHEFLLQLSRKTWQDFSARSMVWIDLEVKK